MPYNQTEHLTLLRRALPFFDIARRMYFDREGHLDCPMPSDVYPTWVYFATESPVLLDFQREIFLNRD